jgi:hypothetical protein
LIKDEDARTMAYRLAAEEDIFVEVSACVAAFYAVETAKGLPKGVRVLCMAPNTKEERYLSSNSFVKLTKKISRPLYTHNCTNYFASFLLQQLIHSYFLSYCLSFVQSIFTYFSIKFEMFLADVL